MAGVSFRVAARLAAPELRCSSSQGEQLVHRAHNCCHRPSTQKIFRPHHVVPAGGGSNKNPSSPYQYQQQSQCQSRPRSRWQAQQRTQLRSRSACAGDDASARRDEVQEPAPKSGCPSWTLNSPDVSSQAPDGQQRRPLNVVLVSPQIPGNAGSIARTCAAAAVGLHLVEPMAFKLDDAKLKRAGLDYWPYVVVKVHSSWDDFLDYFLGQQDPKRLIAFTKRGADTYTKTDYRPGDWLLFGAETTGLPEEAHRESSSGRYAGGCVRIPMSEEHVRSLNLAVSVGIGLYEAIRQLDTKSSSSALHSPSSPPPSSSSSSLSSLYLDASSSSYLDSSSSLASSS
ncbi:hypothetical protein CBR_g41537 [Chara braunii]|uniref:tRNA/rRNA methyltransferase SpoU type domain-containing protein n=1 Tax=Chara braunii TaxID=69332 RepID=A0A388K2R3_CHABU|nr:hypothetical protein CBR_g41537 [Chara braunii]|eukprot:GBG64336.1 hypothetical protein CBR_g41537 [Chara braunii]